MLSKTTIAFGIILTVLSCMSPEKLLNKPGAEKLYFGRFGGFTNIPEEYVLVGNRHVFKIENAKPVHLSRISKEKSEQIDSLVKAAGLPDIQLNEPGNMTYFIRSTSEGIEKEIKWTDQSKQPEVWELFKALNSTVK